MRVIQKDTRCATNARIPDLAFNINDDSIWCSLQLPDESQCSQPKSPIPQESICNHYINTTNNNNNDNTLLLRAPHHRIGSTPTSKHSQTTSTLPNSRTTLGFTSRINPHGPKNPRITNSTLKHSSKAAPALIPASPTTACFTANNKQPNSWIYTSREVNKAPFASIQGVYVASSTRATGYAGSTSRQRITRRGNEP